MVSLHLLSGLLGVVYIGRRPIRKEVAEQNHTQAEVTNAMAS